MSDTGSILHTRVPHKESPNVPLAGRFTAWQDVLEHLKAHFTQISDAEVTHNKQLQRLAEAIPQPFSGYELFEQGGSVHGLGQLLHEQSTGRVTHSNHIIEALERDIIPMLAHTQDYLKERTAHIRGLSGDFKNDLGPSLDVSKSSLASLHSAISDWEANNGKVAVDKDPFVVDLAARRDLRTTLSEENYLRETTINLERSSEELENLVVTTIQKSLARYNDLVSTEAAELAVMSQKVEQSILSGHLQTEWTHFTKRQYAENNLVDPASQARTLETSSYPGKDHISTASICDGWLEKKSKYLNSYSTAFYIISPSRYLHEFKSNDLRVDNQPTFSLYLPECEIASLSKETDKVHRFVLTGTAAGSGIHSDRDWTFRTKSREDLLHWYTIIGRASDPAFQFSTHPVQSPVTRLTTAVIHPELEHDETEQAPFHGPETIVPSLPVASRSAAGRFDTAGYATAWAAAAASLNAQPASTLKEGDAARLATTSYGSTNEKTPVSYPEHDEHLRQASANSAAAHFMDKEILDSNAYLEYDKVHGTHSTLVGDEDFKPANADVSISRTSSVNGRTVKPRRQASLAFQEFPGSPIAASPTQGRSRGPTRVPSRKPTASYGDMSQLPVPSMTAVQEVVTPTAEPYVSPYFPAPGAGTTGVLPASQFSYGNPTSAGDSVIVLQPTRASTTNSGANTPSIPGQPKAPSRKMSLSEQILFGGVGSQAGPGETVSTDLEPEVVSPFGTHDDARSPYPATQRFRVPRSRQSSMLAPANDTSVEPIESYDVAPHMRVGTQSNEARYKVGSRRGSRSASVIATPHEGTEPSLFDRSALDTLSADSLAAKLHQPSSGEKARARRAPSRGASMDLGDGASSPAPAFNVNTRHAFRKPPSRGSSLSLGPVNAGAGDGPGLLNTINETFEKDLAAARGNKEGDRHVPGDFPTQK